MKLKLKTIEVKKKGQMHKPWLLKALGPRWPKPFIFFSLYKRANNPFFFKKNK